MERPRPAPHEEPAPPEPGGRRPGVEARHSLGQSFGWAWAGLAGAAVRERNMRIHLALGILASSAASLLPVTGGERALLLLAVALVVAGEAANSALEAVVDLVSPHWNVRARVAKDAAAGAVLALAGGSVVVLVAIALPALHQVRDAGALGSGAAGAVVAAAAAGYLPWPGQRRLAVDLLVLAAGLGGLALVARAADGVAGVAAAALLLGVAAGGAVRRRSEIERGT